MVKEKKNYKRSLFYKKKKMEFSEEISEIFAFPGVSSLCAFAGKSGTVGVYDMERYSNIYEFDNRLEIVKLEADDEKNIYFADKKNIFRHDIRTPQRPEPIFRANSDILSFSKNEVKFAVSTIEDGIVLQDERKLESYSNLETKKLNICDFVTFIDYDSLLTTYKDGSLHIWKYSSELNESLEVPEFIKTRKMKCLGFAHFNQKTAVCYQSGISIYKNFKLQEHTTFGRKDFFESMCYAPCFENEYIAFATSDGSIFPVNLETNEVGTPKQFSATKISKLSSNYLMLASLTVDSFDGKVEGSYLSTLMAEDFGDEYF